MRPLYWPVLRPTLTCNLCLGVSACTRCVYAFLFYNLPEQSTSALCRYIAPHGEALTCLSVQEGLLAAGCGTAIHFFDRRTGKLRQTFEDNHPEEVTQVCAFTSDIHFYNDPVPLTRNVRCKVLTRLERLPFQELYVVS